MAESKPVKKVGRVRCPFCFYVHDKPELAAHIRARHFPQHCTVCLKPESVHEVSSTSPTYTIACFGGRFIPGSAR